MEKQLTCEERIEEKLRKTMEDIREALADEDKYDEYMQGILCFDKKYVVYRVELSCGGPQDYIDLFVDPADNVIDHAIYHFLDWFDGAQRYIQGDDLDVVRNMFEEYVEML